MNLSSLQAWLVRSFSAIFIISAFLPFYAEFDAEKIAAAASSPDSLVICTADGLKLISFIDGSKKDLPTNGSHKSTCPFYVLSSGHGKIFQAADIVPLPQEYESFSYSSENLSFYPISQTSHKSPRAPPLSLS